jgi:hypothetical protein
VTRDRGTSLSIYYFRDVGLGQGWEEVEGMERVQDYVAAAQRGDYGYIPPPPALPQRGHAIANHLRPLYPRADSSPSRRSTASAPAARTARARRVTAVLGCLGLAALVALVLQRNGAAGRAELQSTWGAGAPSWWSSFPVYTSVVSGLSAPGSPGVVPVVGMAAAPLPAAGVYGSGTPQVEINGIPVEGAINGIPVQAAINGIPVVICFLACLGLWV